MTNTQLAPVTRAQLCTSAGTELAFSIHNSAFSIHCSLLHVHSCAPQYDVNISFRPVLPALYIRDSTYGMILIKNIRIQGGLSYVYDTCRWTACYSSVTFFAYQLNRTSYLSWWKVRIMCIALDLRFSALIVLVQACLLHFSKPLRGDFTSTKVHTPFCWRVYATGA